ncbi:MAG: hypothetical protein KC621_08240 [Myxococcales bacterium]|nr:hypothetical protein [Myxococcales bacterium]
MPSNQDPSNSGKFSRPMDPPALPPWASQPPEPPLPPLTPAPMPDETPTLKGDAMPEVPTEPPADVAEAIAAAAEAAPEPEPEPEPKKEEPAEAATGGEATAAPTPPPVDDPEITAKLEEARAAFDKHKIKKVQELLGEVAPKSPNHPELLLLQAQVHLEKGALDESMKAASKCVEVDAKKADCWLTLGVLHQNNKSDADAIKAYETYLELAPEGRYARDATTQLARLK